MGARVVEEEAVSGLFGSYVGQYSGSAIGVHGLKICHIQASSDISSHGTTIHMNHGKTSSIHIANQRRFVMLVVVAVGIRQVEWPSLSRLILLIFTVGHCSLSSQ